MNEMLVVTVRFAVTAGFEARFAERVRAQAATSLDVEPGCRQFDVCSHPSDPRQVFLYEIYVDDAAFDAHLASPHFLTFDRDTGEWIDEKVVERWRRANPVRTR